MSRKLPGQDAAQQSVTNHQQTASISRRSLLKKSAYHAPALLVLGSLVPVGKAAAQFPSEPGGLQQGPEGYPSNPEDEHSR